MWRLQEADSMTQVRSWNKNLKMPRVLNLLNSSDVVMVLSQLLLVAQAVIPVTQLLVPARAKWHNEDSSEDRLKRFMSIAGM